VCNVAAESYVGGEIYASAPANLRLNRGTLGDVVAWTHTGFNQVVAGGTIYSGKWNDPAVTAFDAAGLLVGCIDPRVPLSWLLAGAFNVTGQLSDAGRPVWKLDNGLGLRVWVDGTHIGCIVFMQQDAVASDGSVYLAYESQWLSWQQQNGGWMFTRCKTSVGDNAGNAREWDYTFGNIQTQANLAPALFALQYLE
jgi:hypothetical protein